MTFINCSLNCFYQKDGICLRDSSDTATVSSNKECVFFLDPSSSKASTTDDSGLA